MGSWGRTTRCVVSRTSFSKTNYSMAGDEAEEGPAAPKKKPKFFVHWNRKKSRFYDYIFDYGENYYSGMIRSIDTRAEVPRRMAFAERGMRSSLVRKGLTDIRT